MNLRSAISGGDIWLFAWKFFFAPLIGCGSGGSNSWEKKPTALRLAVGFSLYEFDSLDLNFTGAERGDA